MICHQTVHLYIYHTLVIVLSFFLCLKNSSIWRPTLTGIRGAPHLLFREVPGPLYQTVWEGVSRPGSRVPGPIFTPCLIFVLF